MILQNRRLPISQCAVICGGLSTAAHFHNGGKGLRDFCPDCEDAVCPSSTCVLALPRLAASATHFNTSSLKPNDLLIRMGWNITGPRINFISQMRCVAGVGGFSPPGD